MTKNVMYGLLCRTMQPAMNDHFWANGSRPSLYEFKQMILNELYAYCCDEPAALCDDETLNNALDMCWVNAQEAVTLLDDAFLRVAVEWRMKPAETSERMTKLLNSII